MVSWESSRVYELGISSRPNFSSKHILYPSTTVKDLGPFTQLGCSLPPILALVDEALTNCRRYNPSWEGHDPAVIVELYA